jgi:hypothetical protein
MLWFAQGSANSRKLGHYNGSRNQHRVAALRKRWGRLRSCLGSPPVAMTNERVTIPEGAAEVIRLALLLDEGPAATYSNRKGIVRW